ncbi:hypothetical protein Pla123a_01200 [Posidoniimonas polymericola]|uniref:SEC-C motif protein n=1 Tax=Posidoniimonas polymericola TaxID=2528002 RepID=A0A5C5ZFI1_9BACT|nr:hypothetical protein [Posidoniimonas polymericola]TWT85313.1 hypothetical protein Pla123a_01200 [Posidoniimonas polymericola]
MPVDPYALCPCGSGKKLKFCCSDLVGEIEKIHRMVEGDQPRAALQHVEASLKKYPGRPSLLDLKAMLELTLHKLEDAEQTVALLLEKDPKNPAAHAQQAILRCAKGDGAAGVEPLQRALVLIEDSMPRRVLEAIGAVGHTLLMEGNVVAARAHLWLYQGVAGREDTRALELLTRLNQVAGLPLLLRDHLYMRMAPDGHPGENDHNYAQALAARGQWGPASVMFDKLCGEYPDQASFHYNRALVHGWLGEQDVFAKALRDFAERDVPLEDAVEAVAIAQLIDPEIKDAMLDVVRLAYPILDEEELLARLAKDPRVATIEQDLSSLAEEDSPPPRAAYYLLDRPLPESGADLKPEAAPRIVGTLLRFGRQTNRAERLELTLVRDDRFGETTAALGKIIDGVAGVAEEEVIDQVDAVQNALRWQWHFPRDTPPKLRRQMTEDESARVILEDWPKLASGALDGKTPEEAAADPGMQKQLAAAVLTFEQGAQALRNAEVFEQLREKLGLPDMGPINADEVDVDQLPLGRVPRLDLAKVDDDDLQKLYQRAVISNATPALGPLATEVVGRPSLEGRISFEEAYRRMVTLQTTAEESLKRLEQAKEWTRSRGESTARWELLELEMYIVEGESGRANATLARLRDEHMNEPGVAEHLYQLFYELGAIPPEGGAPMGGGPMPAEEAPPSGGIWTPDADQPAAGKQKLWTPS